MAPDNRELAWIICFVVGVGLLVVKAKAFEQLGQLIRALFSRTILGVLGLAVGYIAICVWLLSLAKGWQWSNFKTTLIWIVSFALIAVLNYQKFKAGKVFVRTVLLEAIGVNAFFSFITSSFTFSLSVELVLAILIILLVVIYVVAERDSRLAPLRNIAAGLIVFLSLLKLGNSVYRIAIDLDGYASLQTAREFVAPIFLTSMFLPFLYGLYVYATYERIVVAFRHAVRDSALCGGILRRLFIGFGLDLVGLEKWRRYTALIPPETLSQVSESIARIREIRRREKRPYRVRPAYGWLPGHATVFLKSVGLATDDYHCNYDGWMASSHYCDVGDDVYPNNLAYYVEGDEFVVSKLKLVLNVNSPAGAAQAYESFAQAAQLLVKMALPGALNSNDDLSLTSGDAPLLLHGYELVLKCNQWPNGIKGGHDLTFTIKIAGPSPATGSS